MNEEPKISNLKTTGKTTSIVKSGVGTTLAMIAVPIVAWELTEGGVNVPDEVFIPLAAIGLIAALVTRHKNKTKQKTLQNNQNQGRQQ